MTSTITPVPGYGGYYRLWQREHVTSSVLPPHKYDDVAATKKTLMRSSTMTTVYGSEMGPDSRVVRPLPDIPTAQAIQDGGRPLSPRSATLSSTAPRGSTVDLRFDDRYDRNNEDPFVHRPTHWNTTYKTSHDGWQHSSLQRATAPNGLSASIRNRELNAMETPHVPNLLRSQHRQTAYATDYGRNGDNPMDRYHQLDDRSAISKKATSHDLFAGTNKGSRRISGYCGFVPASANNTHSVTGRGLPIDPKDNLLQIYRHDLPGYTGHHPQSVVNDTGPRTPATRTVPKGGAHAGLMLESMKTRF